MFVHWFRFPKIDFCNKQLCFSIIPYSKLVVFSLWTHFEISIRASPRTFIFCFQAFAHIHALLMPMMFFILSVYYCKLWVIRSSFPALLVSVLPRFIFSFLFPISMAFTEVLPNWQYWAYFGKPTFPKYCQIGNTSENRFSTQHCQNGNTFANRRFESIANLAILSKLHLFQKYNYTCFKSVAKLAILSKLHLFPKYCQIGNTFETTLVSKVLPNLQYFRNHTCFKSIAKLAILWKTGLGNMLSGISLSVSYTHLRAHET